MKLHLKMCYLWELLLIVCEITSGWLCGTAASYFGVSAIFGQTLLYFDFSESNNQSLIMCLLLIATVLSYSTILTTDARKAQLWNWLVTLSLRLQIKTLLEVVRCGHQLLLEPIFYACGN